MTGTNYSALDGDICRAAQQAGPEGLRNLAGQLASVAEMPVRPATLLALELLLQEPVVNLCSVVSLLLTDSGAALRVAQLAAREVEPDCQAPLRLAECIATLDLTRLLFELSA